MDAPAEVGRESTPWQASRIPARRSSFKLVQIGVVRGITQRTAHGNHLTFVMKGMGQDMMKNGRRSPDSDVPIQEMKFRIGVELLIRQFDK
jgi:hypothetical protein